MKTNNIKIIQWSWNDLKSIKKSEKYKTKLENLGYELIDTEAGFNEGKLIYKLNEKKK